MMGIRSAIRRRWRACGLWQRLAFGAMLWLLAVCGGLLGLYSARPAWCLQHMPVPEVLLYMHIDQRLLAKELTDADDADARLACEERVALSQQRLQTEFTDFTLLQAAESLTAGRTGNRQISSRRRQELRWAQLSLQNLLRPVDANDLWPRLTVLAEHGHLALAVRIAKPNYQDGQAVQVVPAAVRSLLSADRDAVDGADHFLQCWYEAKMSADDQWHLPAGQRPFCIAADRHSLDTAWIPVRHIQALLRSDVTNLQEHGLRLVQSANTVDDLDYAELLTQFPEGHALRLHALVCFARDGELSILRKLGHYFRHGDQRALTICGHTLVRFAHRDQQLLALWRDVLTKRVHPHERLRLLHVLHGNPPVIQALAPELRRIAQAARGPIKEVAEACLKQAHTG